MGVSVCKHFDFYIADVKANNVKTVVFCFLFKNKTKQKTAVLFHPSPQDHCPACLKCFPAPTRVIQMNE